jgi:2,4-dienoyl-CoA reductase-like NADH-dependent reductase (Old Yellow Enzyme family)
VTEAALFQPVRLRSLTVANRVWVSPMCQYSADGLDGMPTDWHLVHLGALAQGGAGLVMTEATAVSPEGRISAWDLGIWNDAQRDALARIVSFVHDRGAVAAIQLAHAGRKASTYPEWRGHGTQPVAEGGWTTVGPSAAAFEGYATPMALDESGIAKVVTDFAAAARRAVDAGFDVIELHAAHGYLLHQFLSPLSNKRTDDYGGSLENRMRFPLELFDAVRAVFPADRPVTMRVSGTDWVEGGWDVEQTIQFARALKDRGCAAIHVSSGGLDPRQQIPIGPGYQVPVARAVKRAVDMPVVAVGLITGFEQAEAIVGTGDADLVALARGMLYDPRWPWHAAAALGGTVKAPSQYLRSQPRQHSDLFD